MKKLERESKIFIIFIPISISLIIIYGLLLFWVRPLFAELILFFAYQGIAILIAFYKTEKEEKEFKEKRTDLKVFISKRLTIFKSLKILSISCFLLFGLFAIYNITLSAAHQTIFFSTSFLGLFCINFLISIYTLVKFQYLTNKLIYPKDLFEKFNPLEDIPEDLLRYLNLLHTPYFLRESIKYSLYFCVQYILYFCFLALLLFLFSF